MRSLISLPSDLDPVPKVKRSSALRRIKSALCRAVGLPRSTVVSIQEHRCPDPGCPDVETVVALFLDGGKVRRYRIAKAVLAIREGDIEELVGLDRGEIPTEEGRGR